MKLNNAELVLVGRDSGGMTTMTFNDLTLAIIGGMKVNEYDVFTDVDEAKKASQRYHTIYNINIQLERCSDTTLNQLLHSSAGWID